MDDSTKAVVGKFPASGGTPVSSVDFHESNWGLGDHRQWSRSDREMYHAWFLQEQGCEINCACLGKGIE